MTSSLHHDHAELKIRGEESYHEAASCKATRPHVAMKPILDRAGVDTAGSSQVRADVTIVTMTVIGANANDVIRVTDIAVGRQQQ